MANQLQKIFSGFSFGSKKEDSAIGIDIGASSVKVVQLRKENGKALLETYGAIALGPYAGKEIGRVTNLEAEQLAQATKDVVQASSVTTMNGSVSIPSSSSIVFILSLPATLSEGDLATVVPTEARKYIPVPMTDVSLDWYLIPTREEILVGEKRTTGTTDVLVVALLNSTLEKLTSFAEKAEVKDPLYEIEIFSAIRSTFDREIAPVLLFDLGASKTKLTIVQSGVVRAFHIINRGSHEVTESIARSLQMSFARAEQLKHDYGLESIAEYPQLGEIIRTALEPILSEAASTILSYERTHNQTMNKIIFIGGGVSLRGFLDHARARFSCDVSLGNPFKKVEAPVFLDSILSTTGPEFAIALGLALKKLE